MKDLLLILLFTCHFLADFTHLSTNWMLSAKRLGTPLFPIFAHAGVHALLMSIPLFIIIGFDTLVLYLVFYQLMSHFLIDVWKGKMNSWIPALQNPANKWHWILMGFDQLLHAVVIIVMVRIVYIN